jgi:hypothetical protein
MTRQEALQAIAEGVWRQEEWTTSMWEYYGECASGVPDWVVFDRIGGGWVSREIGWYYQRADWNGYDELVKVAQAMDAAHIALETAMQEVK